MDKQALFSAANHLHQVDTDFGPVYIRALSLAESDSIIQLLQGNPHKAQAIWLCKCCRNQAGDRIFTDDELDAICNLPRMSLHVVVQEILRINGLSEDSIEQAKKN